MKTLKLEDAQARLRTLLNTAQSESVLITRQGKPMALIIGVEGHDLEDLRLETDSAFWSMIERRRRQPTMSRAELDEYLRKRDRAARRPSRTRRQRNNTNER